jgi:hypothetical protein
MKKRPSELPQLDPKHLAALVRGRSTPLIQPTNIEAARFRPRARFGPVRFPTYRFADPARILTGVCVGLAMLAVLAALLVAFEQLCQGA